MPLSSVFATVPFLVAILLQAVVHQEVQWEEVPLAKSARVPRLARMGLEQRQRAVEVRKDRWVEVSFGVRLAVPPG